MGREEGEEGGGDNEERKREEEGGEEGERGERGEGRTEERESPTLKNRRDAGGLDGGRPADSHRAERVDQPSVNSQGGEVGRRGAGGYGGDR